MIRVGIVSLPQAPNYGAFLQAFALQTALLQLGCEVRFVKLDTRPGWPVRARRWIGSLRRGPLQDAAHRSCLRRAVARDLQAFVRPDAPMDLVIVGSDEVWSVCNPSFRPHPALHGRGLGLATVCAYAPTVGQTRPDELLAWPGAADGLRAMAALSARDAVTAQAVQVVTGRTATRVLDPTLLIDWESHVVKRSIADALLVYTYGLEPAQIEWVRAYARRRRLRIVVPGPMHPWADQALALDPFEFLGVLRSARAVVTNTFHGTLMAWRLGARLAVLRDGRKQKLKQVVRDLDLRHLECGSAQDLDRVLSTGSAWLTAADRTPPALPPAMAAARSDSWDYLRHCVALAGSTPWAEPIRSAA
jgi:hypothetical protein